MRRWPVDVSVPGQRCEIDVLSDGSLEVEVFRSNGVIGDGAVLEQLISENSG